MEQSESGNRPIQRSPKQQTEKQAQKGRRAYAGAYGAADGNGRSNPNKTVLAWKNARAKRRVSPWPSIRAASSRPSIQPLIARNGSRRISHDPGEE